jgi:hypothetical protein
VAIIVTGTTVSAISGTVGGVTFTRGHCGPYVKQWSQGVNPQTLRQMTVRGRMTAYGALWAGMGTTLQAAWDAFALVVGEVVTNRLQQIVKLSGWAWFVKVNQRRASVGLAPETAVPNSAAVAPPTGVVLTVGALPGGISTLAWTGGAWPSGYSGILFLGVHATGGAQRKSGGYLLAWADLQPTTSPATITSGVLAAFGNVPAGWQVFGKLYSQRGGGVRSPVVPCMTMVV